MSDYVGNQNVGFLMMRLKLSGFPQSLEEFFGHLDVMCGSEHLGVLLKKPDKKKEK